MSTLIRSMTPSRSSARAVFVTSAVVLAGWVLAAPRAGSTAAHATGASGIVATAHAGVPGFGHVFLIVGENTSASQVTAKTAPYLTNAIKPRAAWLTRYYAVAERSLGNYVAMMSGQFNSCEAQNAFSFTSGDVPGQVACHQNVDNLFHQLDGAGISWLDWHESAANPCDMFDHGAIWAHNGYVSHRNPTLYFDDIQANHSSEDVIPSPECRAKVLPAGTTAPNDMSFFNAALAAGNVPRFSLVIPNVCESGSDLCTGSSNTVTQFDDFLRREIPKIEASRAFGANGTIIVTWDEGGDPDPRHIFLIVLGANVKPGTYAGGPFTHYNLLRTLEDGFGLTHLAKAGQAKPLNQIWK